uniref:Bacteriophage protein n=1 Tax=Steinernema glaseri TaxID=37863 RepID=A0A1I7Y7A2_9BILA
MDILNILDWTLALMFYISFIAYIKSSFKYIKNSFTIVVDPDMKTVFTLSSFDQQPLADKVTLKQTVASFFSTFKGKSARVIKGHVTA